MGETIQTYVTRTNVNRESTNQQAGMSLMNSTGSSGSIGPYKRDVSSVNDDSFAGRSMISQNCNSLQSKKGSNQDVSSVNRGGSIAGGSILVLGSSVSSYQSNMSLANNGGSVPGASMLALNRSISDQSRGNSRAPGTSMFDLDGSVSSVQSGNFSTFPRISNDDSSIPGIETFTNSAQTFSSKPSLLPGMSMIDDTCHSAPVTVDPFFPQRASSNAPGTSLLNISVGSRRSLTSMSREGHNPQRSLQPGMSILSNTPSEVFLSCSPELQCGDPIDPKTTETTMDETTLTTTTTITQVENSSLTSRHRSDSPSKIGTIRQFRCTVL